MIFQKGSVIWFYCTTLPGKLALQKKTDAFVSWSLCFSKPFDSCWLPLTWHSWWKNTTETAHVSRTKICMIGGNFAQILSRLQVKHVRLKELLDSPLRVTTAMCKRWVRVPKKCCQHVSEKNQLEYSENKISTAQKLNLVVRNLSLPSHFSTSLRSSRKKSQTYPFSQELLQISTFHKADAPSTVSDDPTPLVYFGQSR